MKHSLKRECFCRCLGVACVFSSRHGQFPSCLRVWPGRDRFMKRRVCVFRFAHNAAARVTTTLAHFQGNATSIAQSGPDTAAAPVIRTIGLPELHRALQRGWEDFKAVPSHAIILCIIYPVLGLMLARAVHGYSVLPLLFPLAAGFALLGPFAALGLYEMSRRRELGEPATAWDALEVVRSPSFGAMVGLGVLLLALFVTWVATAQAIYIAAFGYAGATGFSDFLERVLTTSQGWWLIVVGFLFALVALCISVVS